MSAGTLPNTWAFVYTRNKKVDYAFVVLPDLFVEDTAATSSLIAAFSDGSEKIETREMKAGGRNWTIFFEQYEATAESEPVLDHVGRPIIVIDGIIADQPMPVVAAAAMLADARRKLQSLLRLFWGVPARGPILSSARSVAASAPQQLAPPPIERKPVSKLTPPARPPATGSLDAPPLHRRRERLYLIFILILLTLGLILFWNVTTQKAELQTEVKQLRKCLETPKQPCRYARKEYDNAAGQTSRLRR